MAETNGDATVTTYGYDPAGLAASQSWVAFEDSYATNHQPGGTPIVELRTQYAYDEAGFVASVTRPVDVVQGDAGTQYLRDDQ